MSAITQKITFDDLGDMMGDLALLDWIRRALSDSLAKSGPFMAHMVEAEIRERDHVRTGKMANSVDYDINKDSNGDDITLSVNTPYAAYADYYSEHGMTVDGHPANNTARAKRGQKAMPIGGYGAGFAEDGIDKGMTTFLNTFLTELQEEFDKQTNP